MYAVCLVKRLEISLTYAGNYAGMFEMAGIDNRCTYIGIFTDKLREYNTMNNIHEGIMTSYWIIIY